jgi:ribonuclease MRP protein subunit RMP1
VLTKFRLRAFTTLVADNQFSSLGVVLIAVLARVGRVIGLSEPKADSRPSLATDMDAKTSLASSLRDMGPEAGEMALREYVEDTGEMVQRDTGSEGSRPIRDTDKSEIGHDLLKAKDHVSERDATSVHGDDQNFVKVGEKSTQQEKQTPSLQSRPRKRRKKANAIDELFGDLV